MTTRIHWAAYTLATALLAGCGGGADDPLAPSGQSRQPRPDSVGTTDTIQVHPTLGTLDRQPHRGPLQRAVNPFDIGGEASPSGQLASGRGGYLTGGVGTFRLELAPDLSGRVVFPRMAQAQGDRYYLGVDRFFGPGTVELVSVRRGTGTQLQVVVKFTHPFPQPTDLARPATARKRVDLHIFNVWAGTLIQGTESYFSGADAETTNTQAMLNADTYRELGALVNRPAGVTATVFPGKWVGDQSPNNTDPNLDNYFPNANGWVGTDLLTPRGYGVFPQGGESSVTFLLDPGNAGGPINVDFAILADYQDPRALPDVRANRLPDPFDATQLRYILPYGAGDLQQIDVQVSGTLRDNNATTATVTANIVDLDADAPVATGGWPNNANLNEMPASSGIKSVSASFPQLDSATLTGTEAAGSGSGLPGNPKKWELPLANPLLAAAGDYTGLVRVVDEETDSMNSEPYFQLDPNLVPLATKLPIQAFQAAEVTVTGTTGGGTRTIVIKNDPDNDDPSFVLSLGGDPPDLTSWIDDPATQAIGGLTFDDVVGSPLFAFEGTGFYAAPNETRFGRGIFAVFFN
ncbi:MAG TPA: hypothetical protein VEI97_12240, partial [bacterium]|nr:hypothetical protein [bacterium]